MSHTIFHPAFGTASTFEHGKTYRTAGGHAMQITTEVNSAGFCAKQTDGPEFERIALMYHRDGIPIGTGWPGYQLLLGEIEDQPKFEAGKRYRTRDGRLTEPLAVRTTGSRNYPLQAKVERDPECDWRSWTAEGKWLEHTYNNPLDLLPGAIEDEKAETNTYSPEQYERLQAEINERKSAAVDPICVLQGQIDGIREAVIQLQADAIARSDRELNAALEDMNEQTATPEQILEACDIADPGAGGFLTEEQSARIVAAAREHANMRIALRKVPSGTIQMEPEPAEDREYRSDLRQIHSRLNRQAERFEKLTHRFEKMQGGSYSDREAMWPRIGEHERRLDALSIEISGKANGGFAEDHRGRIESLETWAKEGDLRTRHEKLTNTVDRLLHHFGLVIGDYDRIKRNEDGPPTPSEQAIIALYARIEKLEKAAELTAAVNRLAAIKPQPTHPAFDPDPPKPTIKGGWVNVYRDRSGVAARIGDYVWADKEDADAAGIDRIACIQIPDITEGEGL